MEATHKADQLGITVAPRKFVVSKAQVNFTLYYSLKGRQVWSPLRFNNAALCYGDGRYLETFFRNLTKFPNREGLVMELNLYSFKHRQVVNRKKYFQQFKIKTSLSDLIDELFLIRGAIREQADALGQRDPNRRVSVLMLDLSEQELTELRDPALQQRLIQLMAGAQHERLYFVILAKYARQVPPAILEALDWKAFLSKENREFAKAVYPHLEEETYNVNRALVGLLADHTHETLLPLHDLVYVQSQHKVSTVEVAELEEQAFDEFLKSF